MGEIRTAPTPGMIFGRRVKEERERQRLTQEQVVERLAELGHTMDRSNLGRIERGDTTGQLDALMELALALGVAPIHLILPQEHEAAVRIAPNRTMPANEARAWVRGQVMLKDSDPVAYYGAMSDSDREQVVSRLAELRGLSPLALAAAGITQANARQLRDTIDDVLAARAAPKGKGQSRTHKKGGASDAS